MNKTLKKALILLLVLVVCIPIVLAVLGYRWWTMDPRPVPYSVAPESGRSIDQGDLVGFDAGNGAFGWLGIPYATPPVGDLRWRAPRPPQTWNGTLEATQAGSPCPQLGGPLTDVPRSEYGDVVGDEDCLTLNVWAPATTPSGPVPVMVWIHGGGNTVGYGADYDGRVLAATQDIVVVTFNYRLGVLGWFNHPAVVDQAASPDDASGNFGTLDQIAVLQWVQDNIETFGGDPNRVTVFGESAGGVNTFALLASPLANGLFHRAIAQSGLSRATTVNEARAFRSEGGHPASAREVVSRWLLEQGQAVDPAAANALQQSLGDDALRRFLADLDAVDLIDGFSAPGGMYMAPAVLLDGHVLPARPLLETLADRDALEPVPVMAGTNRDEAKLFMAMDGRYVARHWGVIFEIRDLQTYDGAAALFSDHWRLNGVDRPLDALASAYPGPQYSYRFDWDETGTGRIADMPALMGAAHGFEIPFIFGDFSDLWGIPLLFTDGNEAGRQALSAAMMSYWSEFAHTGTPGRGRQGDLPVWPAWGENGGTALRLDTQADGGIKPLTLRIDAAELHQRFLALQPKLPSPVKCSLYAWLFLGTPQWDPAVFEGMGDACGDRSPQELAANPFSG